MGLQLLRCGLESISFPMARQLVCTYTDFSTLDPLFDLGGTSPGILLSELMYASTDTSFCTGISSGWSLSSENRSYTKSDRSTWACCKILYDLIYAINKIPVFSQKNHAPSARAPPQGHIYVNLRNLPTTAVASIKDWSVIKMQFFTESS